MSIDHLAPELIKNRYTELMQEFKFKSHYDLREYLQKEHGINLDKGSLSKILNGKNDNLERETLIKLALAFRMTPGALLDRVYHNTDQEIHSPKNPESESTQTIKLGKFQVTLKGNITNLTLEVIFQIQMDIRKFGTKNIEIVDVKEGSVIIELEGDLAGFERMKALVESGELKELAGFEILAVGLLDETREAGTIVSSLVSLRDWLQGTFEEGWLAIEQLLTPQQLAPSVFSAEQQTKVERAKHYQLGVHQINLVVEVTQKNEEEVAIALKVYPIGTEIYLPANLRLTISADGEELPSITSREQTRLMQKLIDADFSDKFKLTLALDDNVVTEEFEI